MKDKTGFALLCAVGYVLLLMSPPLLIGCAATAPAAPAEPVVEASAPIIDDAAPAKTCANPNCTCDVCSGDCECGMLTDNQREAIKAQIKRLETNLEVVKEELASIRQSAETKSDDESPEVVGATPVKVNGSWYYEENGQTFRFATVSVSRPFTVYRNVCRGSHCEVVPVTEYRNVSESKWIKVPDGIPAEKPQVYQRQKPQVNQFQRRAFGWRM